MKIFSARGSAPPVVVAARAYRNRTGVPVDVAVCSRGCERGQCGPAFGGGFVAEVGAGKYDAAVAGAEADWDDLESSGLARGGPRWSLGMRESVLLVPSDNPAGIRSIDDLTRPGVKVAVSTVDCLRGVWEDVCGRAGCVPEVRANISLRVAGCMAIVRAIVEGTVDAAFGWSTFTGFHRRIAAVRLPESSRIYRSTCAGLVKGTADEEEAERFLDFLVWGLGREIFAEHGWLTHVGTEGPVVGAVSSA
ncbi:MAG: substrate-binding domain-containing protein [Deltaproteobacteria bacterium]|nr:substrate-binding domain-containing protein [Deltaproteobacteria bacterium]